MMPELSRFYGIVVAMYIGDHNPPHVHARYAEQDASFSIETGEMIQGKLPPRAVTMVQDWITINRSELLLIWESQEFRKLNPLD